MPIISRKQCLRIDPTGASCPRRATSALAEVADARDARDVSSVSSTSKPSRSSKPKSVLKVPLKMLQPTHKSLTVEEMNKAKLVEASKIAYKKSFNEAQSYLDENGLGHDIDTSLSTKEGLVLVDGEGRAKLAYRGTDIRNKSDLTADALIAAGAEETHANFRKGDTQIKEVMRTYGSSVETLGYSLGGAQAVHFANKYGLKSTSYNPFIGPKLLKPKSGNHLVIRTTEDFASLGVAAGGKYQVKSIHPHKDLINPVEAHRLENFTRNSPRRPGLTDALIKSLQAQGERAGEHELMHSIGVAQDRGKTFTSWLHEFNGGRGGDTTPNGESLAGERVRSGSKMVRMWEEHASSRPSTSTYTPFTPQEREHLAARKGRTPTEPATRVSERAAFRSKSPAEREVIIRKEHAKLRTLAQAVDKHAELHEASANALKRLVHPTTIATGLIAGGLTSTGMELIDHDHKIPEVPRAGIEGGVAGAVAEAGAARLAGSVLTGSALAVGAGVGAVGAVAGVGVDIGVSKGLEALGASEDVSEVSGAVTGGMVSGGLGIAAASAMGAELGIAGGPVGIALGAGVGGLIGLGSWLVGKIGS